MDPKFQTSFIPKKSLSQAGSYSPPTIGILSMIATLVFLAAVGIAGGLFIYEKVVSEQIGSYQKDLERARAEFNPEKTNELTRLSKRIENTKKLLNGHLAVSNFFKLLESNTLKTVRFNEFDFTSEGLDTVVIKMTGQANSFSSIALQADRLNANPMFKNTIVDNINLEKFGNVSFLVTTSVDPSVVSYREVIMSSGTGTINTSTVNQNTQTQTTTETATSTGGVIQRVIETPVNTNNLPNTQTP